MIYTGAMIVKELKDKFGYDSLEDRYEEFYVDEYYKNDDNFKYLNDQEQMDLICKGLKGKEISITYKGIGIIMEIGNSSYIEGWPDETLVKLKDIRLSYLSEIYTISDASKLWRVPTSKIQKDIAANKDLVAGIHFKKIGNALIVTKEAMDKLYGVPLMSKLYDKMYKLIEKYGKHDTPEWYYQDNSIYVENIEGLKLTEKQSEKLYKDLNELLILLKAFAEINGYYMENIEQYLPRI